MVYLLYYIYYIYYKLQLATEARNLSKTSRSPIDFSNSDAFIYTALVLQDEERELLPPEHNSKEVKVINDLLEDLTKLDRRQDPGERIPLAAVLGTTYRAHNNNSGVAGVARLGLSKQSSLLSSGSQPDSVIIDTHTERVSSRAANGGSQRFHN